jgi:hypothetical protein
MARVYLATEQDMLALVGAKPLSTPAQDKAQRPQARIRRFAEQVGFDLKRRVPKTSPAKQPADREEHQ